MIFATCFACNVLGVVLANCIMRSAGGRMRITAAIGTLLMACSTGFAYYMFTNPDEGTDCMKFKVLGTIMCCIANLGEGMTLCAVTSYISL